MAEQTQDRTIADMIAQVVDRLVKYRVQKATFDKTYNGIISAILFDPNTERKNIKWGTYKIRFNNTEKIIRLTDNFIHQIGERVIVTVPNNNLNNIIVRPVIDRSIPNRITYDDNKTAFTEHREIIVDGMSYAIEDVYTLEVKNKGTDQEEVTKMILPDGREIEFENWDI